MGWTLSAETWTPCSWDSSLEFALLSECPKLLWFLQAGRLLNLRETVAHPETFRQPRSPYSTHRLPSCSRLLRRWVRELCSISNICSSHWVHLQSISWRYPNRKASKWISVGRPISSKVWCLCGRSICCASMLNSCSVGRCTALLRFTGTLDSFFNSALRVYK